MTADYPAETTIATHTNGSKPYRPMLAAPAPSRRGGLRRIVFTTILAITAIVVLRRIRGGLATS